MPFQIVNAVYTKDLLKVFTGYGNEAYAARRLMPVAQVQDKTGKRPAFTSDLMRLIDARTDGMAPSSEVDSGLSWTAYACIQRDYHSKMYPWLERQLGGEMPAATYAMQACKEAQLIAEEYSLAAAMKTSGNFSVSNYVSPTTGWHLSSADPGGDVAAWKAVVSGNCGRIPDVMAVSEDVALRCQVIARDSLYPTGYAGLPTDAQMASFFGVKEFITMSARYVSTIKGQTNTLTGIWGTGNVWLLYRGSSPSGLTMPLEPSFGRTIECVPDTFNDREEIKDPACKKYLVHSTYDGTPWSYSAALWAHNVLG